jgi:hypothetical protein
MQLHSEFPCHAFAHCKVFAPAAPRRARGLVSVPFSGLQLPLPVQIIALVGHYPANWLICRRPILKRLAALEQSVFQLLCSIGYYPQFPKVTPVFRVGYLRVTEPDAELPLTCMA